LLSNAVKFNKEGGEVTIGSERVTRMDAGDYIRYSLTDTGIGIRRENLKNLFMPFERVEPDQIDYSGRGLGLAVLKKIVLAMNGTYGVESTYGEGSTFWFELPCA
jgi:signal transduction histidine kinase